MAYKNTCKTLAKVADNEPIFVLRAQDVTAPEVILEWLKLNPHISDEKHREAYNCAMEMRNWKARKAAD